MTHPLSPRRPRPARTVRGARRRPDLVVPRRARRWAGSRRHARRAAAARRCSRSCARWVVSTIEQTSRPPRLHAPDAPAAALAPACASRSSTSPSPRACCSSATRSSRPPRSSTGSACRRPTSRRSTRRPTCCCCAAARSAASTTCARLNAELQRLRAELRDANRMLARAEAQYRRIVELQPLVMYIDNLGAESVADFISPAGRRRGSATRCATGSTEPASSSRSSCTPRTAGAAGRRTCAPSATTRPFDEEFRLLRADGAGRLDARGRHRRARTRTTRVGAHRLHARHHQRRRRPSSSCARRCRGSRRCSTTCSPACSSRTAQRRVVMANDDPVRDLPLRRRDPDDAGRPPGQRAPSRSWCAGGRPGRVPAPHRRPHRRRWPAVNQSLDARRRSRVLEFDFQPIVVRAAATSARCGCSATRPTACSTRRRWPGRATRRSRRRTPSRSSSPR